MGSINIQLQYGFLVKAHANTLEQSKEDPCLPGGLLSGRQHRKYDTYKTIVPSNGTHFTLRHHAHKKKGKGRRVESKRISTSHLQLRGWQRTGAARVALSAANQGTDS